jgi:hypothetical protein
MINKNFVVRTKIYVSSLLVGKFSDRSLVNKKVVECFENAIAQNFSLQFDFSVDYFFPNDNFSTS